MTPKPASQSLDDSIITPVQSSPSRQDQASAKAEDFVRHLTGETLNERYRLIEVLGVGGMSTVYRAEQTSMRRHVAVKVLGSHFAQNAQMIRRFEKEARVVSKLSHPNTVSVFDYGQTEKALYLVMELLDGATLKDYLAHEGRLSPSIAVSIAAQILRSLHQAHEVGIVHRDIKPANVFILGSPSKRPMVKVLDFGVAKVMQVSSDDTVTQAGGLIGTPKYMSPEQAQATTIDERSDLYSVGVLLYEMLAGYAPFDGDNPLRILMDHAQAKIPRLPSPARLDWNYGNLQTIIDRCLQKEPSRRYENAQALLNALDQWQIEEKKEINPPRLADERPLPASRSGRASPLWWLSAFALLAAASLMLGQFTPKEPVPPQSDMQGADPVEVKSFRRLMLKSAPKARVTRLSDGKILGTTPLQVTVDKTTNFELSAMGYSVKTVSLSEVSPIENLVELKPVALRTSKPVNERKRKSSINRSASSKKQRPKVQKERSNGEESFPENREAEPILTGLGKARDTSPTIPNANQQDKKSNFEPLEME